MAKHKALPSETRRPRQPAPNAKEPGLSETPTQSVLPPSVQEFSIIAIGASAGGLAAMEAFFTALPLSLANKIALVIVQHLSPDHKSLLCDLLGHHTQMHVCQAEEGMQTQPGCVYIIPPNRNMAILNGKLQLFELDISRSFRHPIDFFFRSLAADTHQRAICIILSGTGSDGAFGVKAVKAEGGMAMVQSPESTEFDGMPRAAIATGLIDYILPPAEMVTHLGAYINRVADSGTTQVAVAPQQDRDALAKIAVLLRAHTGHDFSLYKESTIIRRVDRRMALHQIGSINDYLRYLQQNVNELSSLFRDLLIGVTSFFRDAERFEALEHVAIPRLVSATPPDTIIRIWVCGCSTGEEAYSIAILLNEHLEQLGQVRKIQIFATDIDGHATDQARTGIFPSTISADVSPKRLSRFFSLDTSGAYRIQKFIRDQLIFSGQDVLKDPPFSKLGMVSCRNLLIYLNADVQKRLMPLFHYALSPGGILFLGSAETIGDQPFLFDVLDRKAKLFVRAADVGVGRRAGTREVAISPLDIRLPIVTPTESPRPPKISLRDITERTLLQHYNVSAVLINRHGEILYFHGRTGNYLEPAPGDAATNILAMARDGLRRDLSAAIHHAVAKGVTAIAHGLTTKPNPHNMMVNVAVVPASIPVLDGPDLYVVVLDEKPQPKVPRTQSKNQTVDAKTEAQIAALEQKLRLKDDYLQTLVEETEASCEELKSSNEEMQSVNEEMQSANEELQTSREELQSVNEELTTVNGELQQKVADLSRANNDMNNLLAGTGVGTLFVDNELRITRFTPSVTHIINLIDTDIGRPLADIMSKIVGYDRLLSDVHSVLATLVPFEIEVQTRLGAWYTLAARPYRTVDNVVEGAVITFVDITKRKLAEQALAEAERFRHAAQIETVGIAFFKIEGAITSANEAFLEMIGYGRDSLEAGMLNWNILTPADWLAAHSNALQELAQTGRTDPYEREYLRQDGSRGTALFASWRLPGGDAVVYVISVAQSDFQKAAGI